MNQLITRIIKLSEEIEKFPLGQCLPSDDPDKQMAYLYSFKALVKRFMSSAKRLRKQIIPLMHLNQIVIISQL